MSTKKHIEKQLTGKQLHLQQLSLKQLNAPTIICDGIQTPENFGSILRVADATGSQKIILLDSDLDLRHKKLSKLARNTQQNLVLEKMTFDDFIATQYNYKHIVALEITTQSCSLFDALLINCDAVIVGHESSGIRQRLLALCHASVHLPMFGTNSSMNISHALSVFLYEWRRQEHSQ